MKRVTFAMMVGAALVLLAGVPNTAAAQGPYVQLGVGASIPTGDLKDGVNTGYLAQIAVGAGRGAVGGRVSATYIRHGIKSLSENFRIVGAMADLVLSPRTAGKAKPYLLGGIGVQNEGSSVTGSTSETKFAWNVGAGVAVAMAAVGLFVEARYLTINHDQSDTNVIPISVGLRLGGR